ncbi:SDR family oxidoreductase [Alteromonadaceae bacterium M269]|nr:SDR family oxidoreductase [Alteromonadaceae bacterium M269]
MAPYAQYPSLKDKVVYLTGGATGIGACLVERFASQGCQVIFNDILDEQAHILCETMSSKGFIKPEFHAVDVTNVDLLKESIRRTHTQFDRIDILINNVSNDARHSPTEMSQAQWHSFMQVNLDASFFCCQEVIPIMQAQGGGSIVNMSSINVLIGPHNMASYAAAKAGINGMTKALANQYGVDKIRVNSILPGWVVTERQLNLWLTPEKEQEWQERVAIKGRLLPDDIANLTLFLASDDSKMITGQHMVIDAGRT